MAIFPNDFQCPKQIDVRLHKLNRKIKFHRQQKFKCDSYLPFSVWFISNCKLEYFRFFISCHKTHVLWRRKQKKKHSTKWHLIFDFEQWINKRAKSQKTKRGREASTSLRFKMTNRFYSFDAPLCSVICAFAFNFSTVSVYVQSNKNGMKFFIFRSQRSEDLIDCCSTYLCVYCSLTVFPFLFHLLSHFIQQIEWKNVAFDAAQGVRL